MKYPKMLTYPIEALLLFVGLGAAAAGYGFISEPDGTNLSLTVNLLKNSPFNDFLVPGILLFVVNGLGSLIGAFLVFRKHHYAGRGVMVLGLAMVIWISAQVYWIGWVSWLQPTFLAIGIIELILGFLLNERSHVKKEMFTHHYGSHLH